MEEQSPMHPQLSESAINVIRAHLSGQTKTSFTHCSIELLVRGRYTVSQCSGHQIQTI